MCILKGDYITAFDNHTYKAAIEEHWWLLSADIVPECPGFYEIYITSLAWTSGKTFPRRQLAVYIKNLADEKELFWLTPNGEDLVLEQRSHGNDPIMVPTNGWKDLTDVHGNIVAKVTK